ncbi:MAG TPA: type VI secretion system contractile sheath small subunit [Planctomycetota bacterium]|nr:type VI secretion system contractile sheath small subunit [Planctomycetota bacterium]
MAKDGSVAPRERVNIKYRPATGDATEEKELPLKLLMLGDYTMRADATPLEERKPVAVDKDNFNDVMRSMDLKLDVNVKNTLSKEKDAELTAKLKFESLKDFGPEAIAEQVPELKQLLGLREALVALKGPLGNLQGFRKKIQDILKDDSSRKKLLSELGVGDKPPSDTKAGDGSPPSTN